MTTTAAFERTPSTTERLQPAMDRQDRLLTDALAEGLALVQAVDALALQLAELIDLDLPPALGPAADAAVLRSAAPLYLASELEAAGLIQGVEALAEAALGGAVPLDAGEATERIYRFWRTREQRFSAEERQAFFARLFGTPGATLPLAEHRNTAFPRLLFAVADALHGYDPRTAGIAGADTALRTAAHSLAANLMTRGGGLASFAGRDIVQALQQAVDVLKQPAVQRAVQARSAWMAAGQLARRYLGRAVDVVAHVQRGRAGMRLLAWLAEAAPGLDAYVRPLVPPGVPVREAAFAWLQASLDLTQPPASRPFEDV